MAHVCPSCERIYTPPRGYCPICTVATSKEHEREVADRGFLVTLVPDACATTSQAKHDNSMQAIKGYCRQIDTAQLVAELETYRRRRAS